eukprot:scaffold52252_cov35-Cyclotella_meneghiniana.AAC.3
MNAECFNDVIGNAFPTSKNEGQKTTYNMTLGKPMNLAYSTLGSDKCLALTANSTQYYETNQPSSVGIMPGRQFPPLYYGVTVETIYEPHIQHLMDSTIDPFIREAMAALKDCETSFAGKKDPKPSCKDIIKYWFATLSQGGMSGLK